MFSKQMTVIIGLAVTLAMVLVGGCTGATTTEAADPISGSWTYNSVHNNTTVTATLIFSPDGNFNGYIAGLLTLSGHWAKAGDTTYNVYYNNKTQVFTMNSDKVHISESSSPDMVFIKQ